VSGPNLIHAADRLLDTDIGTGRTRARACALLLRQQLELSLSAFWTTRVPAMGRANTRAQLLCLREYTSDKDAARQSLRTWSALSEACHNRGYGLPPPRETLRAWAGEVAQLCVLLERPPDAR
jgi:hypothetical protein